MLHLLPVLKRAIKTLNLVLEQMNLDWIPVLQALEADMSAIMVLCRA